MNALAAQLYENGEIGVAGRRPVIVGTQKAPASGGGVEYGSGHVYPFIGMLGNGLRVVDELLEYKILKTIDLPGGICNDLKKAYEESKRQDLYANLRDNFPFVGQRYGFWKGFSIANYLYTIAIKDGHGNGKEIPLIASHGEIDAKNLGELAKNAITNTVGHYKSFSSLLGEIKNDVPILTGADKRYLNKQIRYADIHRIEQKLVERDVQNIYQFGAMKKMPISVEGQTGQANMEIRTYERPHGWGTYFPHEIGNWVFDFLDNIFYGVIRTSFGTGAQQQFAKEIEIDKVWALMNSLFHGLGGRKPLEFTLKEA